MYDFHTHTFLSDGVLSPIELIRRAHHIGYQAFAITDHVGPGNMEFVLKTLIKDCEMASNRWDILALPGVEITTAERVHLLVLFRRAEALRDFYDASVRPWRRPRSSPLAVLPRSAADLLEDLQRFGDDALTSAAHPFSLSKNGWMTSGLR